MPNRAEINDAMRALRSKLEEIHEGSLTELISQLAGNGELKEDAIRNAFWFMEGSGELLVDQNFVARLAQVPA